ncbi:hypothetical protein DPMN_072146 [Dreissena polymorpha]|uniref:Uncharacterized protein n=1 Tax=Dreissena polymorpha TaxID=45954 RepID=A0A9D3Z7T5_DREPO|nr:hypothetical protein DPMN_072146 [Dreissena polymorpha]
MDIVSNFHENQEDNVTCRKAQNIIGTNIVTKIHEDRKINVTSRVLTMENAPPPGSHVFQPITYILAKFYEDWNINMASTELTRQMLTAHDGHEAITKAHHEHSIKLLQPKHLVCQGSSRMDEFVGSLPTRGAISLSPPHTPSTGSSQETDSTMPSCNIEVNVKLLPGF